MHIISVTDDKFWQGTAALFQSVEENSQLTNIRYSLIYDHLSNDNKAKLRSAFPQIELIDYSALLNPKSLPTERVSPLVRARLKKLSIFALDSEDDCLYLDSDILCLGSLKPLRNFCHFSACLNFGRTAFTSIKDRPMFNSGVMIFRPSRLLFDSITAFMKDFDFPPGYADQMFLNEFFYSHANEACVHIIGQEYNFLTSNKRYNRSAWSHFSKSGIRLLHYTNVKPWLLSQESWNRRMKEFFTNRLWYSQEINMWRSYFESFENRL